MGNLHKNKIRNGKSTKKLKLKVFNLIVDF